MLHAALNPTVRRREFWAWASYDFANSSYTTVVITALFNSYFVATVAGGADWATLAWTSALAVSYALIVLTAPALGAYADQRAAKKKLLLIATIGCVGGTALLYFAAPGAVLLAFGLIVVSNFFYGTGENLAAAFLPEIAKPEALGRVSGWSWAVGYVGGLIALGACIAYVGWAQARGQGAAQFVPVTMLIVAGLFALAATPVFLLLKERAVAQAMPSSNLVLSSFSRTLKTIREVRQHADLAWLLASILSYQAGIQTVIALAAVYAQQALGFGVQQTLVMLLIVNVTAAMGAFVFGFVQDRLGHRASLGWTLVLWLVTVIVSYLATSPALFWVAANLAGFGLGAAQSAGRALVGYLSPDTRRAEFFGLWGLAVKLASILGPMTYGLVTWLGGGNHRLAMLVTGVFFIIGLLLLRPINVARGRAAALA
jgi:MFS transporter, UMF1 family